LAAKEGSNCQSKASFWTRRRQMHKQEKPQAKVAGGISFALFSLAVKENEGRSK